MTEQMVMERPAVTRTTWRSGDDGLRHAYPKTTRGSAAVCGAKLRDERFDNPEHARHPECQEIVARPDEAQAVKPSLGQPPIEGAEERAEDTALWSVTTIIGALDKPALLYWTGEQSALAAIHNEATWRGMLADDDPACKHTEAAQCPAVKWLRDARFRKPKGMRSATELGELVHAACEQYALTGTRPVDVDPEVRPFLDRFDEWLARFGPSYQAVETAVYHPELGYAGTADGFLTLAGVRYIFDIKTSRKSLDSQGRPSTPYPEQVALQLAAYRWAKYAAVWRPRRVEKFRRRYYLLGPDERAMAVRVPEVDTGLVIHITPDACEAFPMVCDEQVFEAYLAVQDSARWLFQTARTVMGDPLMEES